MFGDGVRLRRRRLFCGRLRLRRFGLGGFGRSGRNFGRGLFRYRFEDCSGRVGCAIRRFGDRYLRLGVATASAVAATSVGSAGASGSAIVAASDAASGSALSNSTTTSNSGGSMASTVC